MNTVNVSRVDNFYSCGQCGEKHVKGSMCTYTETVRVRSYGGYDLVPAVCPECGARESLTLAYQRYLTDEEYRVRLEHAFGEFVLEG